MLFLPHPAPHEKKQHTGSPLASLTGYAIVAVILIGVIAELLRIF